SLALREIEREFFAVLFYTIVEDDFRAVTACRGHFRRRRVLRHRNEHANAGFTTCKRHRLRVIARGKRDDALLLLFARERLDLVRRAANLESTGALKIFALEEDFLAAGFVELARSHYRRAVNAGGDAVSCFVDEIDSQHFKL